MTDAITKPKKDEPEEPRKGTEPVSPQGYIGTGSVPTENPDDDPKN